MERTSTITRLTLAILAAAILCLVTGCESPEAKLRSEGLSLYAQNQYEPALDKFNAALKYNQFDARSNYYAGAIQTKLGHYEQAEYHLKLAWQADPSLPDVKDALTEVLLREGKEDAALDFLERDAALTAKAVDPRPEMVAAKRPVDKSVQERMFKGKGGDRLRVATTYEKIGDMENAKINYAKAIKMNPNSVDVLMAAGQFYTKIGDKTAATEAYGKAYHIDPAAPGLVEAMTKAGIPLSGS
jgi:tetratricopeptide (TPR) repeat protein